MKSLVLVALLAIGAIAGEVRYDGSVFDSLGTPAMGARVRLVHSGLSTVAGPDGGWKLYARLDSLRDTLPDTLTVSWEDSAALEVRLPQSGRTMTGIVVLLGVPNRSARSVLQDESAPSRHSVPAVEGDSGIVTDPRDGRAYPWIRIGGRPWFSENLAWKSDDSWWYGGEDSSDGVAGRLYPGREVLREREGDVADSASRLCPVGWRLPGAHEWDSLEAIAGRSGDAGSALRTVDGWKGWFRQSKGIDEIGFHASPAGYRYPGGEYAHRGSEGFWWVAPDRGDGLTHRSLRAFDRSFRKGGYSRWFGLSIRCIEEDRGGAQ